MPKFYGNVGFVRTVEEPEDSGIWVSKEEVRQYAGDINRYSRRWDSANKTVDDINMSQQVSIIADPFLFSNIGYIRYVEWMNSKWKVTNVEPSYPRMTLEIGGLYNG